MTMFFQRLEKGPGVTGSAAGLLVTFTLCIWFCPAPAYAATVQPTRAKRPPAKTLSDLNGRTIGILVGTFLDTAAEKNIDYVKIEFYDGYDEMEKDLLAGNIDAIFGDEPVMRQRARRNPSLVVLDEVVEKSFYGFAFNKKNRQLHGEIDQVIKEYQTDGTLERLVDKWTCGPEADMVAHAASRGQAGPELHLGTCGVLPPFSYLDADGRAVGMDIEMAEMIARRLGRPLKITVMEFGRMIPSLLEGEVDMIGGAITITPERCKIIDFTTGYYGIGVAALVTR